MSIDSASKGFRNKNGQFIKNAYQNIDVTEKNILDHIKRYNKANSAFGVQKVFQMKELMKTFKIGDEAIKRRLRKVENEKVGIKTIKEWYKL